MPHPKTIAFIHPVFPCGGAENVTLEVGRVLSSQGYRIIVLCERLYSEIMPPDSPIHIAYYTVRKSSKKSHALEMIEKIRTLGIDVLVYVVNYPRHIELIRQQTGARIVVANHGMMYWQAFGKIESLKKKRKKNLWHRLRWYFWYRERVKSADYYLSRVQRTYRSLLCRVDAYMVLCEGYRSQLIRDLSLDEAIQRKIHAIPNFQHPHPNPCLQKEKKVLFVGRLTHADKRVDRLLRVWAMVEPQMPDWELQIVGEGEELSRLLDLADRLQLRNVTFEGRQNPQPYYDRAAILCLTSTHEGWGLVLTEAQTNGVVPIAFDCSAGVHTILSAQDSGECGVLVPPFNLDAYARELRRLMSDECWRRALQQNALQRRFPLEDTCKRYKNMFDSLTNA